MNNKMLKMVLYMICVSCIAVLIINAAPKYNNELNTIVLGVLKLSNPAYSIDKLNTKNGINNFPKVDKTTIAPIQQHTQAVMRPIRAEDSNANSDITATPKDILDLMNSAKKNYKETQMDGKTSEGKYFGGGTLVKSGNIEVQSKLPSSFYHLNIEKLLRDGSDLKIADKEKPSILIYHSHTTEAYSLLDTGFYDNSNSRSNNANKSVVRVGDEIADQLRKAGFNVIHDTKIHDTEYGKSYASSKASIEKYLEQYPSIEVTIDVHRDTITYSSGTKVKPTAKIKNKKAAKMMIIAGCEYGRVKNYPDWEYNLRFDLSVQNKMATKYPGLMRPVMFSERKYNMNMTHNSFLLEVGTDANTLDEACYSGRLFGKALGELLNEKYVRK